MLQRLAAAEAVLAGTEYSWSALGDCVAVRCPWGNIFLVWEPGPAPSRDAAGPDAPVMESFHCGIDEHMAVRPLSGGGGAGIRFVQFQCAQGAPAKIGDFYTRTFSSRCTVSPAAAAGGGGGGGGLGEAVAVCAGPSVHLIFTATLAWPMSTAAAAAASGIHICLYISNFSAAYAALQEQDLIWCLPCPRPPARALSPSGKVFLPPSRRGPLGTESPPPPPQCARARLGAGGRPDQADRSEETPLCHCRNAFISLAVCVSAASEAWLWPLSWWWWWWWSSASSWSSSLSVSWSYGRLTGRPAVPSLSQSMQQTWTMAQTPCPNHLGLWPPAGRPHPSWSLLRLSGLLYGARSTVPIWRKFHLGFWPI